MLDLTQIIEAVLMAAISIGLPYLLTLMRGKLKIDMDAKDAAALDAALKRGVALAIQKAGGVDGINVRGPGGAIGEVLSYLLDLSPELVRRMTKGAHSLLEPRIEAEIAMVASRQAPSAPGG